MLSNVWQNPSRSEGLGNIKVTTKRAVKTKVENHRNSNPLNATKLRRQTIHVCAPGVSTSYL